MLLLSVSLLHLWGCENDLSYQLEEKQFLQARITWENWGLMHSFLSYSKVYMDL